MLQIPRNDRLYRVLCNLVAGSRSWRDGIALTLILSIVAVAGVLAYRHLESAPTLSPTGLELAHLDGHGAARLSDWNGTPLVVNLFASWCPACIGEMPAFERASHTYSGRLAVVGVDSQDSQPAGLRLAHETGVTYTLLSDTKNADLYRLLQGDGMPVTAFITPKGSVARVYSGELDEHLLQQLIDQLLKT